MAPTIDDELLALAGGGSDDSGDEGAATSAGNRRKAQAKAAPMPRKKRRVQSGHSSGDGEEDDEEEDDDDQDDEHPTTYPIEGLYKSWADKQRIESLPLIERESIIAQRQDEQLSRERAAQLAGMVAAQQGRRPGASSSGKKSKKATTRKPAQRKSKTKAADSDMDQSSDEEEDEESEEDGEDDDSDDYAGPATSRGGRKIKSVGSSDTRNAKLAELSENRRKKAAAASSKKSQSSSGPTKLSSDSTSSSEESEGYVESDSSTHRRRHRPSRPRHSDGPFIPPTLEDINRALISRDDILKIMYRKNWQDKLVGCFVRVVSDPKRDERTGAMIPRYRAYEIVDWKKGNKWYAVDEGKYTQVLLVLAFAKEKHTKEIIYVSNSKITPEEYERYNLQAQQGNRRPSQRQVIDQAEEFADFLSEPWTEETLTQVIKAKQDAKKAALDGKGEDKPKPNKAKSEDVLLAELNARNRIADRERIQEANRKQAEIRRAAAVAAAQKAGANGSGDATKPTTTTTATPTPITTPAHKTTADVEIDLGDF